MTVKELRAALAGLPDDAEVLTQAGCCGVDAVDVGEQGGRTVCWLD